MPYATRTTQIFSASTPYGAAVLAAAADTGLFRPAGRRLLLVADSAPNPEAAPALTEVPGFDRLRSRFDEVRSWNEVFEPFHPAGWSPRGDDAPLWERHLRRLWRLGTDHVELAVESGRTGPATALARMFADSPVDVCADGLAVYGPTRGRTDPLIGTRVRRLLHLDLVPGLRPLLLTEFGTPAEPVPGDAFTKVIGELAADGTAGPAADDGVPVLVPQAPRAPGSVPAVLLLGQCLAALDITTEQQEEDLLLRMVRGAAALGHRRLVFKPHPAAPPRWSRRLEEEAAVLGAELTVHDVPEPAEALYRRLRPALVVGCFSTALFTAATLYGIPVARVGTATLLAGLASYQDPDRVPLTIADALLPDLEHPAPTAPWDLPSADQTARELAGLVAAVAFCMRPRQHSTLRPAAESYLRAQLDARTWPYFRRRRLAALGLPGGVPAPLAFIPRHPTVRRIARRARVLGRNAQG